MLRLAEMARLGRPVRQDDIDDLGIPTQQRIIEAIDAGRYDEARQLAQYTIAEGKSLHDLFCDWVWDMQTQVAKRHGEEALGEMLRGSQETWMLRRTWKGFLQLPVKQRVELTAEMMRSHHGGPKQDGFVEFIEDGQCRSAGHGIPAIRSTHAAHADGIDHFRFSDHGGKRESVGQTLGQNEKIGRDTGLFASEERSGPTESGLDLVEDEDRTMFVAPLAQHAQKGRGHGNETPLARHGFDDHRGNVRLADVGMGDFLESFERLTAQTPRQSARQFPRTHRCFAVHTRPAVKIRKRCAVDFRGERTEPAFVGIRFSRERHGHVSAAVKRMLKADHCLTFGVGARKLDRVFHRLSSRVGEK